MNTITERYGALFIDASKYRGENVELQGSQIMLGRKRDFWLEMQNALIIVCLWEQCEELLVWCFVRLVIRME